MVEQGSDKEYLRVKIDLPSFQFEIFTKDTATALPELRKVLEAVRVGDELAYEDMAMQELRQQLSEAFTNHSDIMGLVRKLLKEEEDFRIARISIGTLADIDVDESKVSRTQRVGIRRAVMSLLSDIDTKSVRKGIVHIHGSLDQDERLIIADHVHRAMPTAQLRAFQSPGDSGSVSVECVFFGDFPSDDE